MVPRYAAIDIGSNSIRLEAAEVIPGQPVRVLASDREVTRLGESVFRMGAVSEEAIQNACAVLARMAALYRRLEVVGVRAVATSAIRDTRNQREFLTRASEAFDDPGLFRRRRPPLQFLEPVQHNMQPGDALIGRIVPACHDEVLAVGIDVKAS